MEISQKTAKRDLELLTLETEKMLKGGKRAAKKELKVTVEFKKKKFNFQKKGSLKAEEIVELKRTHTVNIFSWKSADNARRIEENSQAEIAMEIDVGTGEQCERQDRLDRVEKRKRVFEARRICMELLEDVVIKATRYRQTEMCKELVEGVMVDTWDVVVVNAIMHSVNNQSMEVRKHLLERLKREEKKRVRLRRQEDMQNAWRIKWENLERQIEQEMSALANYEHLLGGPWLEEQREARKDMVEDMDDTEGLEYMMEVEEGGMTYEDWLAWELQEMGIDWGPGEESMMVLESQQEYPHHHGGMFFPVLEHPTLPEKGWEGGQVLGWHPTRARTPMKQTKSNADMRKGIATPGISAKLGLLELEDDECLCSLECNGTHDMEEKEISECICTVGCKGANSHEMVEELVESEVDEYICTVGCKGVSHHDVEEDRAKERMEDEALGMKYCPGLELCLPRYQYISYKPSTSSKHLNINNFGSYTNKLCTISDRVGMMGKDMDRGFKGKEMDAMIAKWEGMAKEELLDVSKTSGTRRRSQNFTSLLQKFEREGGEIKGTAKLQNMSGKLLSFCSVTDN